MRSILLSLAICCVAANRVALADSAPLNFEYAVAGSAVDRPTLIFNDGSNTFIEIGSAKVGTWSVPSNPYSIQGPYLVIPGLPKKFTLRYGKSGFLEVEQNAAPEKVVATTIPVTAPHPRVEMVGGQTSNGDSVQLLEGLKPGRPHQKPDVSNKAAPTGDVAVLKANSPEAPAKRCIESTIHGTQRYFVQFAQNEGSLSASSENALKLALAGNSPYTAVTFLQSRDSGLTQTMRARRLAYLMNLVPNQPGATVSGDTGNVLKDAVEMSIAQSGGTVPCPKLTYVRFVDGAFVFDAQNTPILDLLHNLADITDKKFSTEGNIRTDIKVSLKTSAPTLSAATAAIAAEISDADIVLRDDSIVLRFH